MNLIPLQSVIQITKDIRIMPQQNRGEEIKIVMDPAVNTHTFHSSGYCQLQFLDVSDIDRVISNGREFFINQIQREHAHYITEVRLILKDARQSAKGFTIYCMMGNGEPTIGDMLKAFEGTLTMILSAPQEY